MTAFYRPLALLTIAIAIIPAMERVQETPHGALNYQLLTPKEGTTATGLMLLVPPGNQTKAMANEVKGYVSKAALRRGWAVAIPYLDAKERTVFYKGAFKRFPALLASLQKELSIDSSRTIAVGVSNGGIAALTFAAAYPEQVKAVVGTPGIFPQGVSIKNLRALKNMPIFLRVGGKDSKAWLSGFNDTVSKLKQAGADLNAEISTREGHGLAINYGKVLEWVEDRAFGPHSRVPESINEAYSKLTTHDAETSKKMKAAKSQKIIDSVNKSSLKKRAAIIEDLKTVVKAAMASEDIKDDKELVKYLKTMQIPDAPKAPVKATSCGSSKKVGKKGGGKGKKMKKTSCH